MSFLSKSIKLAHMLRHRSSSKQALSFFRNFIAFGVIAMNSAYAADNNNFLSNEKLSRTFSGSRCIFDLAWSPDQSKIAVRGIGKVYLWDLAKDQEIWSVRGTVQSDRGIVISPDNQNVIFPASGEALPGHPDANAQFAALTLLSTTDSDSPTPKYVKDPDFSGGINGTTALALAPDGSSLASVVGIASGWVTLYDPKTWGVVKHIGEFKNPRGIIVNPNMIAIDSNRKILVGAYVTGDVQVWNYGSNTKIAQFQASFVSLRDIALNPANGEIITGNQEVATLRFPDGHTVGNAGESPNELVKAWDPNTGKLIRAYSGAKNGIRSISVSSDGRYIAATEGSSRVGIRLDLWDAATGALLKTIDYTSSNGMSPVKFSPDGRQLAVGNDDEVHIYDLN